ncbi:hypothetical protein NMY22_g5893 [Coprinellus aureogranulatus]|nr:hypothetical protein NMY22_g5893 [Coprinellus aureogranulatus]
MDESSPQDILDQVPMYELARIMSSVYLCTFVALAYHCMTTFGEEVEHVWPQPRWKLGKVIFLTTRYSALAVMAGYMIFNMPNHATISIMASPTAVRPTATFAHTIAPGLPCDLDHGASNKQHLYGSDETLSAGAMDASNDLPSMGRDLHCPFTSSSACMPSLRGVSSTNPVIELPRSSIHIAGIPGPVDAYLGWPCAFSLADSAYGHLYSAAMYLSTARALIAIMLGLVTFIVRYRRQQNRILRVIIREGGLYLASTLVLKLIMALSMTPKVTIKDDYEILWGLNRVFGNVFAERLLLSLRKVDDPGTRAVISSLAFNVTREYTPEVTDCDPVEGGPNPFEESGSKSDTLLGDGGNDDGEKVDNEHA